MIAQLTDPIPPVIGSVYINNSIFNDDHYYPSSFTVTTKITDEDSSIDSYSLSIVSNTTNTIVASANHSINTHNQSSEEQLKEVISNLTDDSYTLTITSSDLYGNSASRSHPFKVNSNRLIFSILAGPNPVNTLQTPLYFGYNLSIGVDQLSIYIINQAGHTLWTYTDTDVLGGYSTIQWDGYDNSGRLVPNGIYYAYCFIKNNGDVTHKRLPITILK